MSNFLNNPQPAPGGPATPKATARPTNTPQPNPGLKQIDGNQSGLGMKPTRAPLSDRSASPAGGSGRSGMESAMGALADKLHPPKRRG